jgi:hypothetical protein
MDKGYDRKMWGVIGNEDKKTAGLVGEVKKTQI